MKLSKKIKLYLPELLIIISMISILILMFFLNKVVTDVGFYELQTNLLNLNRENSTQDFIGIVAKYKMQKKLYQNQINEEDYILKEIKISSLLVDNDMISEISLIDNKKFPLPALILINSIRFIMGENKIDLNPGQQRNKFLDIAYYYERNKFFKKALEYYYKAQSNVSKTNYQIPVIQLHQGYCYSIVGDYENAKEKFLQIISENKNEKITEASKMLLVIINEFQQEIEKVKKSDLNSVEKAEKLFQLMAYEDSIKVLNKSKPKNKKEIEKALYYKARSYEETGETNKSIELYEYIISQNPKSKYAKLSNKRILMMSSTSDNNKGLKELADKNNKKIKDKDYSDFSRMVDEITNSNNSSIKKIIDSDSVDDDLYREIIKDNDNTENKKKEFINSLVTAIEEEAEYTIKDPIFYETEMEKLEEKIKRLEKENKNMLFRINEQKKREEEKQKKKSIQKTETVINTDQFGRIISKYTYIISDTDKQIVSYSIYYYMDFDKLHKIMDYDAKNNLLDYYIIKYDNNKKESQIQKYDAAGNLLYSE